MTDINEALNDIRGVFESLTSEVEMVKESVAKRALQLEDIGWLPLNERPGEEGAGLTLDDLHKIAPKLRDAAATDPLHVRGAQLRHAYIFGKGINFTGVKGTKAEAALRDPYNKAALFSVQAYEVNNLAKFTDGNLFVIRNEKTNILTVIPVFEIKADAVDPDDPSRVRYFLREWMSGDTLKQRWYPVARFKKTQVGRGKRGKIQKTISRGGKNIPVAQDEVIYHETTKRQAGWTYGVPDSLAASVWAVAYREYLRDNATLVKALQKIAWSVTTATKKGQQNAGLAVATPSGDVGGTAVLGNGNALASAGVPSANVNFNNGQPLAAMVATSFGVPVIALLSSPGATGGSYGAATTLDSPTTKGMRAEQDSWKLLYEEILHDMGAPDAEANFPNIEEDPIFRAVQSIGQAQADGRLHRDEARAATLNLLDIEPLHTGLPKPDEFNAGSDPNDDSNPMPSQGNAGAVPGGVEQDITADDQHGDN